MYHWMLHWRKCLLGALVLLVLLVGFTSTALILRGRAAGATPLHIWLHYDYLAGAPDGHSDAPDPAALQLVVDAYAAHGIELEIDNLHNAIPWKPYISIDGCGGTSDTLDYGDVQTQYFHPTSNHNWDYVLFGDRIKSNSAIPNFPCTERNGITGQAHFDRPGFVIALALILQFHPHDTYAVGGIFMHELGHNFGLQHGGDEDTNWKPNYISVMNYRFQFGIPYAATPGSTSIAGRRLDYSEGTLPPLDKSHLNETLGIGGGPTDTDITSWSTWELPNAPGPCCSARGPASGPIDWNQDGNTTDTDVKLDVNYDPLSNTSSYTAPYDYGVLHDFNDWAHVRAFLRCQLDPTLCQPGPGPKTIETDGEAQEPVVSSISPSSGSANGGTTVTITGTHLGKATQVVFGGAGAAQFTIVNDQTITAVAPLRPKVLPGGIPILPPYTTDVTVVSGAGPSPSVTSDQFTYLPASAPTITSVSPMNGPFAGGTTLLIKGSGFRGATAVSVFLQAASFTALDDSTISAVTPNVLAWANYLTLKTHVIVTTTWGGSSAQSSADQFTYLSAPPPVITSISPASGPASGGTTILIKGSGFTGATSVSIGIPVTSFTVIDDSTISVVTPNVLNAATGQPTFGMVDVTVTTPGGGSSAPTPADEFTYL